MVDIAGSLGQASDKGFFKNQAQIHIAAALETPREIGADVTLENAYHLLIDQGDLDEAMTDLASGHQTARRRELAEHFSNRFPSQPPEQIGGVKEAIANYLQAFITQTSRRFSVPVTTPSTSPTLTVARSSVWRCHRNSNLSVVT